MSKRDVNKEYLQLQSDYFEALALSKDFDEMLKNGDITQDVFDEAQNRLINVKRNYDIYTYILFLLNKPNRKFKKWKEEAGNKEWYEYLSKQGVSGQSIRDESHDALIDFKKFVMEEKTKHGIK